VKLRSQSYEHLWTGEDSSLAHCSKPIWLCYNLQQYKHLLKHLQTTFFVIHCFKISNHKSRVSNPFEDMGVFNQTLAMGAYGHVKCAYIWGGINVYMDLYSWVITMYGFGSYAPLCT
jgi:hypothetical protein